VIARSVLPTDGPALTAFCRGMRGTIHLAFEGRISRLSNLAALQPVEIPFGDTPPVRKVAAEGRSRPDK
jgi:hypothetical protein